MKKHYCFIGSSFNRQDSLIVMRQGKSLVEAGYEVTYLVCDGLPNEDKYGIHIINIGKKAKTRRERIFNSSRKFKKILKNITADIYQISEPELLPLGLYLKRHKKIVVYNLREYYPYYLAKRVKPEFRKIYSFLLEMYFKYAFSRFDAVFNCMPEMDEYIKKIMPCKLFENVTNYPIVNRNFRLSYEDYCKRGNVINYFGSIYTISCQHELLDAISNINNIKYLLAGKIYSKSYEKSLKQHKAWSKVQFIDGFPREELSKIINSSSIGYVLKDFNQTETPQGSYSIIKIFETMEAAIPVILAKVPLYQDMVDKYKCGICVNPHDSEEIKRAILFLINNKKEAYEMGQNGRKAVLKEFSWDSQFVRYRKIIEQLLNK